MTTREKPKGGHAGGRPEAKGVPGANGEKHVVVPASPEAIRRSLGITKENVVRVERLLVASGAYNT
jgi:hypothetical protein